MGKSFEEFYEQLEECNKKLNDVVNKDKLKQTIDNLCCVANIKDFQEKTISVTYEQVSGKMPICLVKGNKYDIAFAISQLMDYDNDFYGVLDLVCTYRRVYEVGGFKVSNGFSFNCKNEEQQEVFRELWKKSPEELEKIKRDMSK